MDSDSVVIQKVYSDDSGCSLGYISFPPNSVKENCSNDYYDMVRGASEGGWALFYCCICTVFHCDQRKLPFYD